MIYDWIPWPFNWLIVTLLILGMLICSLKLIMALIDLYHLISEIRMLGWREYSTRAAARRQSQKHSYL